MTENDQLREATRDLVEFVLDRRENISKDKAIRPINKEQLEKVESIPFQGPGRELPEVLEEAEHEIFAYGNDCAHPRFFGFVPGPASPLSWLGDFLIASYNRHGGAGFNQPAVWAIEKKLIRFLANKAGYPEGSSGLFVSGGSMANLTAVTVARDTILKEEEFAIGTAYVSEQTHSSVEKGLRVIGISRDRIRKVPTDKDFKMDMEALEKAIKEDEAKGLKPFLVIATVGTTNTGSIDPLKEIRTICDDNGMWMHIDGAYGASALLSSEYRHELEGTELSDSLAWDGHKWLYQTNGCGMVFFRDQMQALNSYAVHPEYLKDLEVDDSLINPWDLGIELTRPVRCMKLWLTMQVMGLDLIDEKITRSINRAKEVERILRENPNIQIVSEAKLAIVNFRYVVKGMKEKELDRLNSDISAMANATGEVGVFTTELKGKKVLRMCIINPDADEKELETTLGILQEQFEKARKRYRK